jgi:hypothetical protein
MKKIGFPWFLGIIYIILIGLFSVNWGEFDVLIQKILYLIAPITALASGWLTLLRMGWQGKRATILKHVIMALGFWLVAEVLTLYATWKGFEQYPSISDVCFWIGYILFSVAIIQEAKLFNFHVGKINKIVLLFLVVLYGCIIAIVGYFGIVIAYKPDETWLVNAATISWSIGDLINGGLGMVLLAMAVQYHEGIVKRSWVWFVGATIINLLADTIYNMYPNALTDGSLLTLILDFMWVGGYFLYAGYFLEIRRNIYQIQKKVIT